MVDDTIRYPFRVGGRLPIGQGTDGQIVGVDPEGNVLVAGEIDTGCSTVMRVLVVSALEAGMHVTVVNGRAPGTYRPGEARHDYDTLATDRLLQYEDGTAHPATVIREIVAGERPRPELLVIDDAFDLERLAPPEVKELYAGLNQLGIAALPWAAPPILDILILTLVGHLIRRLPRMEAPHVWLVVVPVMMLSANTVVAVLHAQAPGIDTTPVQIPLLFTYFVTAVMMCDPRMGLGVQLAIPPRERPSLREDNALIVLSTVPAITAAARPLAGDLDGLVRGVSVGLLVGLLIIRLWLTLRALKKSEARSAHRAAHDPLTSLFNRSALLDRLECLLESNRAQKKATVVVFLDCDRFKHINDTWGHHVGDELLRLVAQRLTNRLQEGEVVARQGGDEFVVLATVETYAEVVDLGERVRAAFIDPFSIVADELHTVTSSVGIAVASPDVAMTVDGILVAADTAMYEAKSRGPGHCVIADSHLDTCTATADAFVDPTMARPEPA